MSFHKGEVATLAWSPTGEFLASGDNAGRLVISEANGRPVSAFEDKEAITALAWNAEGKRAAGRVVLFSD